MVKPFNPIEVVARAKAVLRRSGLATAGAHGLLPGVRGIGYRLSP